VTEIKLLFSLIATALAIISFIPYTRDICRGKTKPHAFSWFVWALLAFIAAAAQLADGGGVGALALIVTGVLSLGIAGYSFFKGTVDITRGDWTSLTVSLAAIPLWLATKNPLWSVLLISIIDVVAFWPTFRKSYHLPHSETLSVYWLSTFKHALAIAALQNYSVVTVLYPLSLAVTTLFFTLMLMVRRKTIVEKIVR
jgi:hypothetical protein